MTSYTKFQAEEAQVQRYNELVEEYVEIAQALATDMKALLGDLTADRLEDVPEPFHAPILAAYAEAAGEAYLESDPFKGDREAASGRCCRP